MKACLVVRKSRCLHKILISDTSQSRIKGAYRVHGVNDWAQGSPFQSSLSSSYTVHHQPRPLYLSLLYICLCWLFPRRDVARPKLVVNPPFPFHVYQQIVIMQSDTWRKHCCVATWANNLKWFLSIVFLSVFWIFQNCNRGFWFFGWSNVIMKFVAALHTKYTNNFKRKMKRACIGCRKSVLIFFLYMNIILCTGRKTIFLFRHKLLTLKYSTPPE